VYQRRLLLPSGSLDVFKEWAGTAVDGNIILYLIFFVVAAVFATNSKMAAAKAEGIRLWLLTQCLHRVLGVVAVRPTEPYSVVAHEEIFAEAVLIQVAAGQRPTVLRACKKVSVGLRKSKEEEGWRRGMFGQFEAVPPLVKLNTSRE